MIPFVQALRQLQEIEALEQETERKTGQFLVNRGWKYVCNTPGSFWLWEKEIKGTIYRCPRDTATEIEIHLVDAESCEPVTS
jgi:hypothetical protein